MTQSNCSRFPCLMIPLMFSNHFMKHKCSLFKAEDDNIFLLPTDLMYKTDPELRAIAEVFVFEKTVLHLCISMCFYSNFCWRLVNLFLYLYHILQDYASDKTRFLMDLATAWNKLATADRCRRYHFDQFGQFYERQFQ